MIKNKDKSKDLILRLKAGRLMKKKSTQPTTQLSESESMRLIHELEVHQIELELQNKELAKAQHNINIIAKKYTELYDLAPSGYFTLSKEGEINEVNLYGARMLGKDRKQLKNSRFGFFVSDDTKIIFNLFLGKVFSNKKIDTCEVILSSVDNISTYINLSGRVTTNSEQCFVTAVDVTERKQAKEALQINLTKYQVLFDSFPIGISLSDKNGNIVEINEKAVELLGLTVNEQLNRQIGSSEWSNIIQTDGSPFPTEEFPSVIALKENRIVENIEMGIVKRENETNWINVTAAPVPIENYGVAIAYNDITERLIAEEEIKLKNNELQKINGEKDKFFSIIAHDLRGPFGTFLGFTEMMVSDWNQMEQPEVLKLAEMMQKSASNLYILLNNLLEWSQIQQGSIPFIPTVIKLRSIIDESIAIVNDAALNKGIELACSIQNNLQVFTDIHFLQTVIRNLVSNAIKFTPEGGKVSLSAKVHDAKNIELSIRDTGIGMSKAIIDNLFRADMKTNRLGTNNEPSSGLGLLLCKEFIERYGGQLWVESDEGQGSTFYFTIPHHVPEKETNIKKFETIDEEIETKEKAQNLNCGK